MYQPSSVYGTYRKIVNSYGFADYAAAAIDSLSTMMTPTNNSDQSTQGCLPVRLHGDLNVIPVTDTNSVNSDIASDAPVISSVWLEQGEYFFDDEFSVPYDAQLQPAAPAGHSTCEAAAPTMTRSLVTELCSSESGHRLPSGQSHSASFFSTPVDSCESGQTSGQTEHAQFMDSVPVENQRLQSSAPARQPVMSTDAGLNHVGKDLQRLSTKAVDCSEGVDGSINRALTDGASQRSFLNGSVGSCETESNSWMQMIMERSCNPELKALLNRTAAAAADYKLTFGDNLPNEGSTLSDWSQKFGEAVAAHGTGGLGRSVSQGNMFDLNSFSGLRRALQQAGASLSKKKSASESEHGLGHPVGVGDSPNSAATTESTGAKANSTTITTWAQKHGSRESLKRKSLRTSKTSQLAPETATTSDQRVDHTSDSWQALKQANESLMTWTQLKRTANSEKSRDGSGRESRPRLQMPRRSAELTRQQPDVMMEQRSCPDATSSSCNIRSRSQPVCSTDKHMHRFSGTLFEIFMRTRVEDICPAETGSSEDRPLTKAKVVPPQPAQNVPLQSSSTVRIGNRNVPTFTTEHGRRSLESDKHPLLRGDRILPHRLHPTQFSPMSTSMIDSPRYMRNCGTQVPSIGPTSEPTVAYQTNTTVSPTWSNGVSTQPVRKTPPSHPEIAACLTVSAGSDSKQFATIRANYLADGYATGWLANPRASIAYPGLGLLSVPRPSRLGGTAFLSNTLPDLSFLGQAAAEEERKGTPTMPKRSSVIGNHNRSSTDDSDGCCCRKCGCRSVSTGRAIYKCRNSAQHQRAVLAAGLRQKAIQPEAAGDQVKTSSVKNHSDAFSHPQVPDLVSGHTCTLMARRKKCSREQLTADFDGMTFSRRSRYSQKTYNLDRSTSEPDLMSAATLRRHYRRQYRQRFPRLKAPLAAEENEEQLASTAMLDSTTSTEQPESRASIGGSLLYPGDSDDTEDADGPLGSEGVLPWASRPKKSVSFSGKVHLPQLQSTLNSPSSPEPKAIPRSWGLYGQVTPVAEFNTRASPGRENRSVSDTNRPSDVDLRYHAMVNEVMKAVQETIAYFSTTTGTKTGSNSSSNGNATQPSGASPTSTTVSTPSSSPTTTTTGSSRPSSLPLPYTAVAALGSSSSGRAQALLAVVGPLTVLLCDGLIPPSRPIFVSKPRTKLWQMVEESCRPSSVLTGVTLHVLTDALQQVKSLPNIASEKVKLKAFICACLNSKALPMWLNALVGNDNLLRRFYCQDAFVRQCRSTQRGLHADLMTHVEQLLAFPFNIDLSVEARRPLVDPSIISSVVTSSSTASSSTGHRHQTVVTAASSTTMPKPTSSAPNRPTVKMPPKSAPVTKPAVLPMLRRQPGGGPNRITPVPTSSNGAGPAAIPHYPPHHLPASQRNLGRAPAAPRPPLKQQAPTTLTQMTSGGDLSGESNNSTSNSSTSTVSSDTRRTPGTVPSSTAPCARFRTGLFRRTPPQGQVIVPTKVELRPAVAPRRADCESQVGKRLSTPVAASKLKQPCGVAFAPR